MILSRYFCSVILTWQKKLNKAVPISNDPALSQQVCRKNQKSPYFLLWLKKINFLKFSDNINKPISWWKNSISAFWRGGVFPFVGSNTKIPVESNSENISNSCINHANILHIFISKKHVPDFRKFTPPHIYFFIIHFSGWKSRIFPK